MTLIDDLRRNGHHEAAADLLAYQVAMTRFGTSASHLKADVQRLLKPGISLDDVSAGKILELAMVVLSNSRWPSKGQSVELGPSLYCCAGCGGTEDRFGGPLEIEDQGGFDVEAECLNCGPADLVEYVRADSNPKE